MRTLRTMYCLLAGLILLACGRPAESGRGTDKSDDGLSDTELVNETGHGDENVVALTRRQREVINLRLGNFTTINIDGAIRVTGELELYPEDEATVGVFMEGNISRILVKPGEKVREGQVLAYVRDPAFIDLQADLRELQSEYDYLYQEYERQKTLYENNVASGKNYQRVTSDYKSVAARLESIKTKLRLLHVHPASVLQGRTSEAFPVVSPITGYVREIGVTLGERVTTGTPLFRIMNKENIHADLLVYEKDLDKIREGQQVTLYIANNREKPVKGKITEIGKNYENTIRAVRMHASLEGKKETFVPGMFVEGLIAVQDLETNVLPGAAVVEDEGKTYIFVKQQQDNHLAHKTSEKSAEKWMFTKTEVQTGSNTREWIEVKPLTSLPENAEIVTEGAYYLLSEMKKGEATHSH
ncbi:efflux RND transporter periplasmic adaptor subunit [Sinomicrobium oceani]|uniref:efflux RND transporter periplasmic adaptor subunit n=1 Tax=Sinomicrobium oceani TaxID=1150368 RepID=UPI00227C4BCE|nr:efflux RND transporter periplasmic adaptor subunit [Sinomicrobium oceani]